MFRDAEVNSAKQHQHPVNINSRQPIMLGMSSTGDCEQIDVVV